MSINFGCNIVYLHLDRHVMLTCYLRHTVTSIICLVFLYSDFSYNISKLHLTRSVFESFRSQPKIEPELNSCNELSKIVFKVKLGSFVTAQRGCGAHFRYVGPLTLWWVRTHFFQETGPIQVPVSQFTFPWFSQVSIYRPARKRGWTVGWPLLLPVPVRLFGPGFKPGLANS